MHFSKFLLLASVLSLSSAIGVDYAAARRDVALEDRGIISDAIDKVQDEIEDLGEKATSVAGKFADKVTSVAAEATGEVGDAVEKIVGGTDRIANALKNALQDLDEEATSKIEDAAAEIESFAKTWQRQQHFSESLNATKNERILDASQLKIDCFDCHISGGVDIDANLPSLNEMIDILQGQLPEKGAFTLSATIEEFTAHLNLSVEAILPGPIPLTTIPLIASPVLGPNIGGLVGIGPQVGVEISIGMTVDVPITFSTGFDFKFEKSTVTLDVLDLDSSTKSGFAAPEFTPQEFKAQIGNINVTFSAALRPYVSLGLVAFEKKLGVSLSLQSPKLALVLSELDENVVCERFLIDAPLLDHNILVTPQVEFNLIAAVDLPVRLPVIAKVLAGTTFSLDPGCSTQTESTVPTSIPYATVTGTAYTTDSYPQSATYAPSQPYYTPIQSSYAPSQPSYSPEQPYYSSSQPIYVPNQPSYAPSQPAYAPSLPTYSSTQVAYGYQSSASAYVPPYSAYSSSSTSCSSSMVTSYVAPPQYTTPAQAGYY